MVQQTFLTISYFCVIVVCIVAESTFAACPKNTATFIKTIGSVPSPNTTLQLLHEDDPPHPVTLTCIEKCLHLKDCAGFVLHYDTSSCYWYVKQPSKNEILENQADSAWFEKICLEKVERCGKLWALERVPGAILVDKGKKRLNGKVNREECEKYCLTENDFECRSANFQIDDESKEDVGICTLNTNDRHFLPNSYRVSSFYDEYFENQCINVSKSDFCSYEEYENATLRHVDEIFPSKTKDECQSLCDNNVQYNCRGYSLLPSTVTGVYTCYLHSEDTKLHGPKVLTAKGFAKYFEKARCLNITVSCSDMYMTVKYKPELDFFGKLYMQGYSENLECFAKGLGKDEIVLKMPVFRNQCGITQARSDYNNRTLMSGVLIIQYNQLIQTQGDRLIRVGCIFGNQSKILVGTGVKISSSRPNIGSTIVNSSNIIPVVEMRVIDHQTQTDATDTQIGQELQMIIEIKPPDGPYDIWAGHLVAMTEKGEESIFLLDDRGCPTNLNIFPAFTKIRNNETNRLVANFQAFKFSVSPVVKFSVIVQFCPKVCPTVDCRSRVKRLVQGEERRKRLFSEGLPAKVEELPLEFVMVVRNPRVNSDRFVYGDGKVLLAGYDLITNEVCIDYSLLVGLILTWILIQVITLISCIMLVRRYKKYYEQEVIKNTSDELHRNFGFGVSNLDNRRVHWADNGSEFN